MAERIQVIIDGEEREFVAAATRAGAAATTLGRTVEGATRRQSLAVQGFNAVLDQQRRNWQTTIRWARRGAIVLAGLFAAGVVQGVRLNAQWESINASLATFLGSVEEAEKFMERLRDVTRESPLRLTEYAEAARLLMGFGVEAEKVIPLLDAVNKAVIATGKGEEEMMRVVRALGQMQAKGKASAEELNQLAEAGVPVNKILQRELGLTGEEIANIGNEGVRAEEAIAAIAKGWRREYGAAYEDARSTFSFQLAGLKKDFEQALRLGSEPLFELLRDKVMPRLNEELSTFIDILDRDISWDRKLALLRVELDRLRDEIGDLDLGDRLLRAFNDAVEFVLPRLAEGAGKLAITAAKAFATGFLRSEGLGRLVLGAWFIKALGGWKLFGIIGRQVGAVLGIGISQGVAATAAGGVAAGGAGAALATWPARMLRFAKGGAFLGVGAAIGAEVMTAFERRAAKGSSDVAASIKAHLLEEMHDGDFVDNLWDVLDPTPRLPWDQIGRFRDLLDSMMKGVDIGPLEDMADHLQRLQETGGQLRPEKYAEYKRLIEDTSIPPELRQELEGIMEALGGPAAERLQRKAEDIRSSFQNLKPAFDLDDIRHRTTSNWREIVADYGRGSEEASRLARTNFFAAREAIREAMRDKRISTREGLDAIEGLAKRFNINPIGASFADVSDDARAAIRGTNESLNSLRETAGRVAQTTSANFGDMSADARKAFRGITDSADESKTKTSQATGRLAQNVSENVAGMVNAVADGLGTLKRNTNRALDAMGVGTVKWATENAKRSGGFRPKFRQRGGPIDEGAPSGDSVPAMLERDEYVLNRNAVKRVGRKTLDAINFGIAPRGMQAGGMAGLKPGISRLAQFAGGLGLRISSGLRPGTGSFHNTGEAVDLVPPSMSATQRIFAAFRNQLEELFYDPWGGFDSGQRIGAIGDHLDHIHAAILGGGGPAALMKMIERVLLTGPDGPLKDMGQAALDRVRKGANAFIRKNAPTHGNLNVPTGPIQQMARALIDQTWGMGQWGPFAELVQRESGWDPTAVNPSSGAAGLAQALPPSKYPAAAWPYRGLSSAKAQLQWMIDYIRGRYGTPAGALAFHDRNNWYREGGLVERMRQGGFVDLHGKGLAHLAGLQEGGPAGTLNLPKNPIRRFLKLLGRPKRFRRQLRRLNRLFGEYPGLGRKAQQGLLGQHRTAEEAEELAQRASALNTEDAKGNTILGQVGGRNELQWLGGKDPESGKQYEGALQRLFALRNMLIRLRERMAERAKETRVAIARGRALRKKLSGRINDLEGRVGPLQRELGRPRTSAARKQRIRSILGPLRERLQDARKRRWAVDRLIEPQSGALHERLGTLSQTQEKLTSDLENVQGRFSPQEVLKSLPAAGVLGGRIETVQSRLRQMAAEGAATDTGPDLSEQLRLTEELLRQSQLKERLGASQFQTFSQFFGELGPGLPFLGAFARGTGGLRVGSTGVALLHRDEAVVPDPQGPHGTQTLPVRGGDGAQVVLTVEGDAAPLLREMMKRVDARVDGRAVEVVDHVIGRRMRQRATAPGR